MHVHVHLPLTGHAAPAAVLSANQGKAKVAQCESSKRQQQPSVSNSCPVRMRSMIKTRPKTPCYLAKSGFKGPLPAWRELCPSPSSSHPARRPACTSPTLSRGTSEHKLKYELLASASGFAGTRRRWHLFPRLCRWTDLRSAPPPGVLAKKLP